MLQTKVDTQLTCDLCEKKDIGQLFEKNGHTYLQCRSCDFVFLDFNPQRKFLNELYSQTYFNDPDGAGYGSYVLEQEHIDNTVEKRLEQLRALRPRANRLLEVGSGPGFFLNRARENYEVSGVELSTYATQYAKRHLDIDIFNGTLFEAKFNDAEFDIVLMWDVIEHVPGPTELVREIHRVTKPTGLMVLSTGDVDSMIARVQGISWRLYDPPYHLNYFSRKTIKSLLEKTGFDVLSIKNTWEHHSLRYILFALSSYYDLRFLRYLKRLTQDNRIGNINIKLTAFDVMTIFAQKSLRTNT